MNKPPISVFNDQDNSGCIDYYKLTMDWINQQYDLMPTSLIHIPLSETELSEQSYYDAMGRWCGEVG